MKRKLLIALCLWLILGASAYAGKRIIVDLSTQTATAYENGAAVFSGNISTGTVKRPTPTGSFRVLEKDIDHISTSWPKPNGGAKMSYMLRLTNYGIAMHLGYVPSYPASHGCIRLQNGFAQRMYGWAHVGVSVRIVGHAPSRVSRIAPRRNRSKRKNAEAEEGAVKEKFNETVSALDMLSNSPKTVEKVHRLQDAKWKNRPKRKAPKLDPLRVMRG